ncbi:MAG: hypothetical protein U5N58_10255 [Actinomycetota bacterium]|nr:hypothetical protein [Actinomycetota bacterium]
MDHLENKLPDRLIGIDSALAGCREAAVKEEFKNQLNNGLWLDRERVEEWPGKGLEPDEMVKIKDSRGHLLAIYKVDKQYQPGKEWLRPMVILN